jgi:adenylate cyclase
MEFDEETDLGRLTVTVAFADLAGYTRFTEEAGEEEALSFVERFVEAVADTIPEEARIVKTIGDEVMIVSSEPNALVDWAVGFERLWTERPLARIGMHHGRALYRDGDYFGRDVNLAARVVARARGGEVLVSDAVIDATTKKDYLEMEDIGEVKLKGFDEPVTLCRVQPKD